MILKESWQSLRAQFRAGLLPFLQILLYGLVVFTIARVVSFRGTPQFIAQRDMPTNHLIVADDVAPRSYSLLGPPLLTAEDFAGRYVSEPVKSGAVVAYEKTAGHPIVHGSAQVLWLGPDEFRYVDAQRLDAGDHVDICISGKKCPYVHVRVVAVACERSNPQTCKVGLLLSDERRMLVSLVDAIAAVPYTQRIDLIRTHAAEGTR